MWGVGTAKREIEGRLKPHESLETFQAKADNYLDFQKSPSSDFKWRGTKVDLSRLRSLRSKRFRAV